MYKPKMADSVRRNLVLAAFVSAIVLAGTCTGAEPQMGDSGSPSAGVADSGDTIVLPLADPSKDALDQEVSSGLTGFISPAFWPFSLTVYEVLDMILRTFVGQQLPCTVWSLVPPKVACTTLD